MGPLVTASFVRGEGADPAKVEFFEKKIRPALAEHCLSCHSDEAAKANKLRGGLRLDTRAGWQKGGDTGPAIVPGKPKEGTFLPALRYVGEVQMPPKGKLPLSVVADFETWIADGAIDPRGEQAPAAAVAGIDLEKGKQWWAFQPLSSPKVPAPSLKGFRAASAVDSFLAAGWVDKKLSPTPEADRRTLVRRAYLDLLGLPPTPEQVEAFLNDTSPGAWAKLIDSLLASPHYGERWGRYWLDVARYAEDQAHTFGVKPKTNAFRYRDWVVAAFNADMPYDEFVRRQLAGDLMPVGSESVFTRLAGLGFLGLGAEYYKNTAREQAIAEELDDRVDTITRGFLGLTVSCARCHDHKFDPVPTRDYYSMAGIFYGSNLTEKPLAPPETVKAYNDAQAKVKQAEDATSQFLKGVGRKAASVAVAKTSRYLVAARKIADPNLKAKPDVLAKAEALDRYFLDRWVQFLQPANAAKAPAPFKPWFALKADASVSEVEKVAMAVQTSLADVAIPDLPANGKPLKGKKANANDPLTKAMFVDQSAPLFMTPANAEKLFLTAEDKPKLAELRSVVAQKTKESPPAPPMTPVIAGGGQGMKVYIRGNPAAKGEDAPKGFLRVLDSTIPKADFSRLELADAIVGPAKPLAARVIVNRVWAWHFGRGLVGTPSNFGKLGDKPSHPELLEYLTEGFVKNGGSLKWLHRQIMGAAAYRLSSEANAENAKIDGANVYLWHGTRKRLDVEAWRDSLLAISGTLDPAIGGPTFDMKEADARRRTVYAKVSRHELNGLLRLFDFPDANVTADRRTVTTVPQQQLFALNSDFVINQAKAFAKRMEKLGATDAERIAGAYRLAYGRAPDAAERDLGLAFLQRPTTPDDKLTRWQQYAQALLMSNEVMYID